MLVISLDLWLSVDNRDKPCVDRAKVPRPEATGLPRSVLVDDTSDGNSKSSASKGLGEEKGLSERSSVPLRLRVLMRGDMTKLSVDVGMTGGCAPGGITSGVIELEREGVFIICVSKEEMRGWSKQQVAVWLKDGI